MVVKYYDQSRVAYSDRNFHGVLATGEARLEHNLTEGDLEIDRFLRFAEPPEHDEWESTENLRKQYQRGFRTALDDMFGTVRDGLRHLIAKSTSTDTLSDNVLNRFPIHGDGVPRSTASSAEPVFEIDSSSRFTGDRGRSPDGSRFLPRSSTAGRPSSHLRESGKMVPGTTSCRLRSWTSMSTV
ncbi:hypothetical protein [Haloterrigena sp. H1]|uniref:hypothetical protein n=1 Tax=Haloterrigena sp. H1 TaxID=2552943 RepID=UPI001BB202CE|nr:hypothetical protein [Haloterrigena sp. H1]